MHHYKFKSKNEYWIAHGPSLHFGKSQNTKQIDTGQAYLEIFDSKSEWENRVRELGGEPELYDEEYEAEINS